MSRVFMNSENNKISYAVKLTFNDTDIIDLQKNINVLRYQTSVSTTHRKM